ncbi:MAG TPA: hypothetical protein VGS78_13595 [Candidatus Sulfotelmatobacter sp.]|nr:hypothetical protein [Candidatus Sulfotelmatobacter sp.]
MRFLALLTLLSAFAPSVLAQRMGHGAPPYAGRFTRLQVGSQFHHDRGFPGSFYSPFGYGFFPPDLYADDGAATPQPSQPVIVMQAPAAPAPIEDATVPAAEPLMIELQGDRYVQVSGTEDSSSQRIDQPLTRASKSTSDRDQPPQPNSPVLLVFRDGHSEEISSYTIENGTLYSTADYYTAGSWNRKIELSSLNIPATLNSNRSRGVPFMLPTAPNEVVVGP